MAVQHEIDSLNARAYDIRYTSAVESNKCADEVIGRYSKSVYSDGFFEAYINKAFAMRMLMRFDSVKICCDEVLRHCDNDLLCAKADVCMMSVCNQTGQSKEFYDYRNDARERLDNVAIESDDMSEHQKMVWNSVQAQYQLASLGYFARMRQEEDVDEAMNWLSDNQDIMASDSTMLALWLVQKAVLGLKDGVTEESLNEQRRSIVRLLSMSVQHGYKYLVAESMRSLAQSIERVGPLRPSQQVFVSELVGVEPSDSMGMELARKSVELFHEYGNKIGEGNSLILLSECELKNRRKEHSLAALERALQLVNIHHKEVNATHNHEGRDWNDVVYSYSAQQDSLSTEMMWIADDSTITVPEWMAAIRQQLSIVYGAMGMKTESDYNHNIYFDILDATRLDQKAQQEQEHLDREERVLNILISLFVVAIILLVWILFRYSKKSGAKYRERVAKLSSVIEVCKKMTTALSDECEDEEMLVATLHSLTDADVLKLFPQTKGNDWTLYPSSSFNDLDKELFNVLLVFYGWILEKGKMYISFADEERRIEAETFAFEKKFEDNKRLYLEKLTSMGIINGITPFLDRALHEVDRLIADKSMSMKDVKKRLTYVGELIDKINEYNDVLGHWAVIRKGMVALHVENFSLQPLLDTLRLGTKTFANKDIDLKVEECDAVVKADKSLTLFMMNTLLDNARKYTPQGGKVSLKVKEEEAYVEVSVSDTGRGMSAEDVDTLNNSKVYDSGKIGMQSADAEELKASKGFGFGLMNCKGIIEKYKKTNSLFSVCLFGVESELGKGSRFFFRLPKGTLKSLSILMLISAVMFSCSNTAAEERDNLVDMANEEFVDSVVLDEYLCNANAYADSVFACNVLGDYELALSFADSVIGQLNAHYLSIVPEGKELMSLGAGKMVELDWWKDNLNTDYNLIISIRNEVAISALALNRVALYRYNCEVFTRLYKLLSTDDSLEEYCASIKQANRDKKATAVVLGVALFVGLLFYLLLHYRHNMLFSLNLRQFILLTNEVFSASEKDVEGVLKRGVEELRMSDNEEQIKSLVAQVVEIHNYYSNTKVEERNTLLELKEDLRRKAEMEEQKVYVQNMIMDNCISSIKHETMYYPNRIKQIVDKSMEIIDSVEACTDERLRKSVADIDELLSYYKEIFTILSECAGKQVEKSLFKRQSLPVSKIAEMVSSSFRKMTKKSMSSGRLLVDNGKDSASTHIYIYADKVFMSSLIENVLSLYVEHCSGGDLLFGCEVVDEFVKFSFTDTKYELTESEIKNVFYVDSVRYNAMADKLEGMQYILAKQIVREHDERCNHRGCRIYVENTEDGGSSFVFMLPRSRGNAKPFRSA